MNVFSTKEYNRFHAIAEDLLGKREEIREMEVELQSKKDETAVLQAEYRTRREEVLQFCQREKEPLRIYMDSMLEDYTTEDGGDCQQVVRPCYECEVHRPRGRCSKEACCYCSEEISSYDISRSSLSSRCVS